MSEDLINATLLYTLAPLGILWLYGMKMREEEETELKSRRQWWSGVTGKRSVGEFTIWTTCVRVVRAAYMVVEISEAVWKYVCVWVSRKARWWQSVGRRVCICEPECVCMFDGWAGRARPRIRVQTNWVINENDRGAVMGPTPKLLMHADQHWQPFVLEKWGCCHWDEETMFILERRKVSPSLFPFLLSLSLALSASHTQKRTCTVDLSSAGD